MNKVILDTIKIENFKGIASATFGFDEFETTIKAENGAGKSTIKNAFEWLLCQNVADVLPMLNNKEIPNLTTYVSATFNINGYDYLLERESKGKYTLNKETGTMNKVTNENTYKIDGMEYKEKDYKEKLANLLSNGVFENLQILTDKEYFNTDTTKFKWTDRRKVLFEICGVKNAVSTIVENPKYDSIREFIVKGHATSDIKSMLAKAKKGYKDQQTKNNILIEQKVKENNELSATDFEQVSKDLEKAKGKLAKMLSASKKENQSEQIKELQDKIFALTREKSLLETADMQNQSSARRFMQEAYNEAENLKFQYNVEKDNHANLITKLQPIIDEDAECPVCHNKLKAEQIEQSNAEIKEQNTKTASLIEQSEKNMATLKEKYNAKKQQFEELKAKFDNFVANPRIKEINDTISATQTALQDAKTTELNVLSSEQKTSLEMQISGLEREMAKKSYIENNKISIENWKTQNRTLADNIVKVEEQETSLANYVKEQTDIIIETVNEKFSNGVSWALYKETYKAGEGGIEEDCICLYNGKRYSSLSMGEKNIANLEVVKTLQDYFGVNITIFADNNETTTIPFDSADRQIIKLEAHKGEKLTDIVKITDIYKGV